MSQQKPSWSKNPNVIGTLTTRFASQEIFQKEYSAKEIIGYLFLLQRVDSKKNVVEATVIHNSYLEPLDNPLDYNSHKNHAGNIYNKLIGLSQQR